MLSEKDAQFLTRVGPGTPMGDFFRQYWVPVAMSSELPEPDCPPLRVRLLGEDLVAFRTTSGEVGLIGANCPHRGASLFFGRNEESGLRCVYHGWKFDTSGRCVDMPNEPPESNFKEKVRAVAYPCEEHGRLIWAYMGPLNPPPPFPDIPFTRVPEDQVLIRKMYENANWLQNLQGSIDPSHAPFLHGVISEEERAKRMGARGFNADYHVRHEGWRFECVDIDTGVMIGARLPVEPESYYWRVNLFLMPFYTLVGNDWGEDPLANIQAYVPIDDTHTMSYTAVWHPLRPLSELEHKRYGVNTAYEPPEPGCPGSEWLPTANHKNDFLIDREMQRKHTFTGIPTIAAQDNAVVESQGPLGFHAREHLGTTDLGIIATRRAFLRAARALRENGTTPPGVLEWEGYQVRGPAKVLPGTVTDWVGALRDYWILRPGVNLPMP